MITSPAFRGRRYAVLGLARSGMATVRALTFSGAHVTAWDADAAKREAVADLIHLGEHSVETIDLAIADPLAIDLSSFDGVVVSPGVPINRHPIADAARVAGVPLIGDIELFAQARASLPPHKVVGITGTNGKSTTTALVHHILQTAGVPSLMGGNIGLPILSRDPLPAGGVYVLELSSYQIDLTFTLDCDVAVLLNITPDHLDRYEGFDAYAASKARLFEMQGTGVSVIIADDEPSRKILESFSKRPPRSSQIIPSDIHSLGHFRAYLYRCWRPMVAPGEVPAGQDGWPALQGPHNLQNAAAAIAACGLLGVSAAQIEQGLRTYPGLPHRMERIAQKGGVLYVNDSKATNPTSTAPALAAYPAIHWIVGGQAKTDDLDACEPHLGHVRAAYTIGDSATMYARLLAGRVPVVSTAVTLEEAVRAAAAAAEPGEVVLLSPACASFDQFKDFEARGDAFRALVEELA
jgi:UDP-N-acetylmuramoylalanine--D-glutamate ligase